MWIFLPECYLSVVQKRRKDKQLCVRARCAADLNNFRTIYCPQLGPTIETPLADYPYRAFAPKRFLAAALFKAIMQLSYDNFKSEVAWKRGHAHAAPLHDIWSATRRWMPRLYREPALPHDVELRQPAQPKADAPVAKRDNKLPPAHPRGYGDSAHWMAALTKGDLGIS